MNVQTAPVFGSADSLTPYRLPDGPAFLETMEAETLLAELADAVELPAEQTPTGDPCALCGNAGGVVLDHNAVPVHPQCHASAHIRESAAILRRALAYVTAVAAVYGLLAGVDTSKVTDLAASVNAATSDTWGPEWL